MSNIYFTCTDIHYSNFPSQRLLIRRCYSSAVRYVFAFEKREALKKKKKADIHMRAIMRVVVILINNI